MNLDEDIKLIKELIEGILKEYERTIMILGNLNQRIGVLENGPSTRTNTAY
jgi:hypothetical protein